MNEQASQIVQDEGIMESSNKIRTKPRMSIAKRKQIRKLAEQLRRIELKDQTDVVSKQEEADLTSAVESKPISEQPPIIRTSNPVDAFPHEIDIQVARQLSDSSNFIAKRCLEERRDEDAFKVQKILLAISRAHRTGIISIRDKSILKDVLLEMGSQEVYKRLASMPGGSKVLASLSSLSQETQMPKKTSADPRLHVFRNPVEGYTVTMAVPEGLRMENALKRCNEHCAVSSNFVCLQPNKIESQLHDGTKQVLNEPNAGGRSFNSEALSFETLHALFGASNLIPEMSVRYIRRSSIVDYICTIFGHRVGVSVTRAMHFLGEDHFQYPEARSLIERKLAGLDRAGKFVVSDMRFHRQILHVWAQSERVGELCCNVFKEIRGGMPVQHVPLEDDGKRKRSNSSDEDNNVNDDSPRLTICLVTVCDRLERFVFANEGSVDYERGLRDPHGFEAMKRALRRQEEAMLTRMITEDLRRKQERQRAVQRVLSTTKLKNT